MFRLAVATSLGLLVGCNNSGGASTGFTTPGVTTQPADTSSGESTSTGDGLSSTSSTSTTSTGSGSADGSTGSSTTSAVFPDMGVMPDFGGPPMGCKGKIDFLFVISRSGVMGPVQDKLVAAAPAFLATIQAQFDDFDLHIMVVDSEPQWWVGSCEDHCPAPCKNAPGYPCGAVPSACDTTVGAGTVYNVGPYAPNVNVGLGRGNSEQAWGQDERQGNRPATGEFASILGVGETSALETHNRLRAAYNRDGALVYRV